MPQLSLVPLRACVAVGFLFVTVAAHAQQQPVDAVAQRSTAHAVPVPSATAARRTGPIRIDGHVDEDAWSKATPISEMTQIDPDEGKPATQRSDIRFVYDDEALYVSARLYDTAGPAGIRTRLVRRDADMESDWFQIVIDGYHDHLSRAFFQVNPSGVKFDALSTGNSNPDASWDGIWETATSIDSLGWSVEIRIP